MQTLTHEPLPFSHTFGLNMTFCHCLRSVVVIVLSYQPSAPGFGSQLGSECVMQELGRKCTKLSFFLLQNLVLQLGLGRGCQPEGIAITWEQLFSLQKRRTITLECGSLRKFCTTSSLLNAPAEWRGAKKNNKIN